jgi:hypothetical protein
MAPIALRKNRRDLTKACAKIDVIFHERMRPLTGSRQKVPVELPLPMIESWLIIDSQNLSVGQIS